MRDVSLGVGDLRDVSVGVALIVRDKRGEAGSADCFGSDVADGVVAVTECRLNVCCRVSDGASGEAVEEVAASDVVERAIGSSHPGLRGFLEGGSRSAGSVVVLVGFHGVVDGHSRGSYGVIDTACAAVELHGHGLVLIIRDRTNGG